MAYALHDHYWNIIVITGEDMYDLNLKYVLAHLLATTQNGILDLPMTHPLLSRTRSANAWNNTHKPRLALLVAECVINRIQNRHMKTADSFFLGNVKDLRNKFGRIRHPKTNALAEGFDLYNSSLGIFYMAKQAVNHQVGAAWRFTDAFLSKLEHIIDLHADYKQLQRYFRAHTPPAQYDAKTILELDTGAIMATVDDDSNGLVPLHRLTLFAIGMYSHLNGGTYPQYYRQNKTHRLYSIGSSSMQSVKREVREAALTASGYNGYDMQVAAFSILLHFVPDRTAYVALDEYTRNRSYYRKLIADETGTDEKHVKTIITATLFGADAANDRTDLKIPTIQRRKIAGHQVVKQIKSELNQLKNEIVKKRNLGTNKAGINLWQERKRIEREARQEATNKSRCHWKRDWMVYLYQLHERLALDAMRSVLNEKDDCLLIHDGLYTKENISPDDFEKAIQNQTGLTIKIDQQVLHNNDI